MLGSIQARRRQRPARARRSGWLLAALVAVSGCTGEEASACSDLVAEAAAEIVELRDAAAELTREDLARLSGRAAEVTGPYIEVRDELRRRAVAQAVRSTRWRPSSNAGSGNWRCAPRAERRCCSKPTGR